MFVGVGVDGVSVIVAFVALAFFLTMSSSLSLVSLPTNPSRREQGTPLMQAAAGKNAQTYRAVMDAIRSRLGVETLVRNRPDILQGT